MKLLPKTRARVACPILFLAAAAAVVIASPFPAAAQIPALTTQRLVRGLSNPLYVTAPEGDLDRLFVLEQRSGQIKIIRLANGEVDPTPFLDLDDLSNRGEQGLLGMAFHPDYATNGLFYVSYTDGSGTSRLREYRVSDNPDLADPSSARNIISVPQPFSNHNGGWIGFGPNDGYLYYALGDGGSGNDPGNRAQDVTNQLLGKILRLDVGGDDFPGDSRRNYAIPPSNPFVGEEGDDEIWAYGLRNPWRDSFDRLTGDFYIADVGQDQREEINYQPAESPGGENYGWRIKEGSARTGLDPLPDTPLVDPIHEYSHSQGISITGGYVYRGNNIGGDLPGTYFFGDFGSARIWSFRVLEGAVTEFVERTDELDPMIRGQAINSIASFGEDGAGNLYIVDHGGEIYKLLAIPAAADADLDGDVDLPDFLLLKENFGSQTAGLTTDFNSDGRTDLADFLLLKNNFGTVSTHDDVVAANVPEPGAWTLLLAGAGAAACARLWSKRRRPQ